MMTYSRAEIERSGFTVLRDLKLQEGQPVPSLGCLLGMDRDGNYPAGTVTAFRVGPTREDWVAAVPNDAKPTGYVSVPMLP